jgi:BRCT domain, a BRCA1 C-terminus domain
MISLSCRCAYSNTPKASQVRGKGKIVTKSWIESCFSEQKKIPWRHFALFPNDKAKPDSDEEILCEWNKKEKEEEYENSEDDMLIIECSKSPVKVITNSDSEQDMMTIDDRKHNEDMKIDVASSAAIDDSNNNARKTVENEPLVDSLSDNESVSSVDITKVECSIFEHKKFYLHNDLSATDVIKLKDRIKHMLGVLTKNASKADFIIAKSGRSLPQNCKGERVKDVWVHECYDLQVLIPTKRYIL